MNNKEFIQAYKDNHKQMRTMVNKFIRGREDRDDVFQDALLSAWEKREQFRGESKVGTWLCAIARNTAINFLESLRAKCRTAEVVEFDDQTYNIDNPEKLLICEELGLGIQRAMNALNPKKLQAFDMHHFQGLSNSEAAEAAGIPIKRANQRLNYARAEIHHGIRNYV